MIIGKLQDSVLSVCMYLVPTILTGRGLSLAPASGNTQNRMHLTPRRPTRRSFLQPVSFQVPPPAPSLLAPLQSFPQPQQISSHPRSLSQPLPNLDHLILRCMPPRWHREEPLTVQAAARHFSQARSKSAQRSTKKYFKARRLSSIRPSHYALKLT